MGELSPASDPGDFAAELVAEVDCGSVRGLPGEGGPEFELVALAVALVATVAAEGYVDGEVPGAAGCGRVQGTGAVPLIAGSLRWFEVE